MQYDLVVYKNDFSEEYVTIKGFENDSTLQGIIKFTTLFDDHNELMEFMYDAGFIPISYTYGTFRIHSRKSKKSEPNVIPGGIAYSSEKAFFTIPDLANYYAENANNPEFMIPLIQDHFTDLHSKTLSARRYLYSIRHYYLVYLKYGSHLENTEQIDIYQVTRDFVFTYSQRINGKGQQVPNYSNLRDLAMYAINFERNKTGKNPDDIVYVSGMPNYRTSESIQEEISHYRQLLSEINPDDEEYPSYKDRIDSLENQLELKLARRKKGEITTD